jgi:hypothetical protein
VPCFEDGRVPIDSYLIEHDRIQPMLTRRMCRFKLYACLPYAQITAFRRPVGTDVSELLLSNYADAMKAAWA